MNWIIVTVSVLALAAIGWGVYNYEPKAVPLVLGSLVHIDLFFAGRRTAK